MCVTCKLGKKFFIKKFELLAKKCRGRKRWEIASFESFWRGGNPISQSWIQEGFENFLYRRCIWLRAMPVNSRFLLFSWNLLVCVSYLSFCCYFLIVVFCCKSVRWGVTFLGWKTDKKFLNRGLFEFWEMSSSYFLKTLASWNLSLTDRRWL